jgi:hypothetical protein
MELRRGFFDRVEQLVLRKRMFDFTDIDYSSCRYGSLAEDVAAGQIANIFLSDPKPDESG